MKKVLMFFIYFSLLFIQSIFAQQITVNSPNGGENWQNSNAYGIVWTDNIPEFVKIELYKNGSFNSTIIASTPSDGFHLWTPNVTESGTDYKIKIISTGDSSIFDFSDAEFSITQSDINVITPNGGENLKNSTAYGIIFSDNFSGPVKIELFKGGMFHSIITPSAPSNGFYLWTPNVLESGNDYKVKISSVVSSNDFDFSDADFTITKSELTVTSPNGGENLSNSVASGIVWSDDISGHIKIELFKGGAFRSIIVDSTPSNGFYLWTPNVTESGSDYKVKISSVVSSNDFDFSDADFSITKSELTVTTPNGGEDWKTSTAYGIVYSDNLAGPVKIELFKGGAFNSVIIDTTPSNGFYLWTPNVTESGSDYKVKISSVASSNDFDFSDADFSIIKSELGIVYPNGGEILQTGSDNGILWNDDLSVAVKIELFKSGAFYSTVIDTTPSNGYFLWSIPDTIPSGNDYSLKITSLASSNDFDFSDTTFSINNSTGIDELINQIPGDFALLQNYPNPFNPTTSVVFGLPHSSRVSIILYNAIGEKVDVIFNGYKEAGYHKIQYNASSLNSGVYFYRIQAGSPQGQAFIETKKMIVLK